MQRSILLLGIGLLLTPAAHAGGLLIPAEPDLPPLAIVNHHVDVSLEDQVAVTRVRQTFRNHTDRELEATYVFPVPAGASVREFVMWSNGSRMQGELLKSDKAAEIYTSIVRQTKNPALLNYVGNDLLSLKIYPIKPQSDQRIEISFTTIAKRDHDLVEYVYPLQTDRTATTTLEEFKLTVRLKSQQAVNSIYSPTHDVDIQQVDEHTAEVSYRENASTLDRDFKLFYSLSGRDIGLTAIQHRPIANEDGYAMLLISPNSTLAEKQKVPRDVVFVIDTSGSMMRDGKMKQAKAALDQCLGSLASDDRFALINFATTVNRYRDQLVQANEEQVQAGKYWVDDLYSGGGTAIHRALQLALSMRDKSTPDRMFTIVFFTDGMPTIGETKTDKILADVVNANTHNTRIFTFGLGDDLNAVFLDQLAEQTKALSSYVRPEQDIEVKVASFFNKIHHPVLANLTLWTTADVQLAEVYPPQLPDLFHGDQLVVLARYRGQGDAAIILQGAVGSEPKDFTYEVNFARRTTAKPFVEQLWARRKVGYLLDQIRINGEQQELVDAVVKLATNYGITTPYTSYLIMPDAPVQVASAGKASRSRASSSVPAALARNGDAGADGERQATVAEFARRIQKQHGDLGKNRGRYQDLSLARAEEQAKLAKSSSISQRQRETYEKLVAAKRRKVTLDLALSNYRDGNWRANQIRKLGVDLSACTTALKCQTQLKSSAICRVNARNCMEIGGVWIDDQFTEKTKTLAIRAQSDAYFKILQRQPQMRSVFALGNHLVWIAPNGTALVVDTTDGQETLADREIDMLFATKS